MHQVSEMETQKAVDVYSTEKAQPKSKNDEKDTRFTKLGLAYLEDATIRTQNVIIITEAGELEFVTDGGLVMERAIRSLLSLMTWEKDRMGTALRGSTMIGIIRRIIVDGRLTTSKCKT